MQQLPGVLSLARMLRLKWTCIAAADLAADLAHIIRKDDS